MKDERKMSTTSRRVDSPFFFLLVCVCFVCVGWIRYLIESRRRFLQITTLLRQRWSRRSRVLACPANQFLCFVLLFIDDDDDDDDDL